MWENKVKKIQNLCITHKFNSIFFNVVKYSKEMYQSSCKLCKTNFQPIDCQNGLSTWQAITSIRIFWFFLILSMTILLKRRKPGM